MMAKLNNKNIFITTSTFAEYDRRPLDLLEKKGFHYQLNPYRRKLTGPEFVGLVGESIGVIAGTEDLNSPTAIFWLQRMRRAVPV